MKFRPDEENTPTYNNPKIRFNKISNLLGRNRASDNAATRSCTLISLHHRISTQYNLPPTKREATLYYSIIVK
ncbi:MAG: hypothetical protein WAM14_18250 [Candidatus Nitrosopolaris sp.]